MHGLYYLLGPYAGGLILASIGDSRMRLHSLLLSLSVVGSKCHKRPKQEKERKGKKNKMLTESERRAAD